MEFWELMGLMYPWFLEFHNMPMTECRNDVKFLWQQFRYNYAFVLEL